MYDKPTWGQHVLDATQTKASWLHHHAERESMTALPEHSQRSVHPKIVCLCTFHSTLCRKGGARVSVRWGRVERGTGYLQAQTLLGLHELIKLAPDLLKALIEGPDNLRPQSSAHQKDSGKRCFLESRQPPHPKPNRGR
eukprot:6332980-Amphidinium_carterae.1